jgi:hypothetical protein
VVVAAGKRGVAEAKNGGVSLLLPDLLATRAANAALLQLSYVSVILKLTRNER